MTNDEKLQTLLKSIALSSVQMRRSIRPEKRRGGVQTGPSTVVSGCLARAGAHASSDKRLVVRFETAVC